MGGKKKGGGAKKKKGEKRVKMALFFRAKPPSLLRHFPELAFF